MRLIIITCLVLTLAACGESQTPGQQKKREPKPHLVETVTITRAPVAQTLIRTGSLRARHETKIITQEEGQLIELPFYEGDSVKQGQVLFKLDDTLLRAQLKKASAVRRQAEQDLKRLERLQHSKVVSEEELHRARTALDVARAEEDLLTIRLGNTYMKAPFSGVITARLAEPGDVLARFSQVLTLTNPDSLVTEVSISELLLPTLSVGDNITMKIDAFPGWEFTGRISRIHPTVDPSSRLGIVEVALKPAPQGLVPGQLCRVTLTGRPLPRLLIPFNALQRDAQGEYVYVVASDNKVHKQRVASGSHFGEQVEILDGLEEGQNVVTKGYYDLMPGISVQVIQPTSGDGQGQ